MDKTFGTYLKELRESRGINLRKMAELLGVAPAYISDIEKGKRNSPKIDKMEKIVNVLALNEEQKNILYDLAANDRDNVVAPDISDYVMSHSAVRVALRKAREINLGEQEWLKIIENMINEEDNS